MYGPTTVFQRVFFALAIAALAFRIVAPPGTMVAETSHGAALVICSGHGPMSGMEAPAKVPASKARSNGSCEFASQAAHALASAVPNIFVTEAVSRVKHRQPAERVWVGYGLAAPPPPSRAPPILFL